MSRAFTNERPEASDDFTAELAVRLQLSREATERRLGTWLEHYAARRRAADRQVAARDEIGSRREYVHDRTVSHNVAVQAV